MSTDAPVIEIRDLHKSYGVLEVLKGVSLTAPKGHVISLIGSSGSGKSTLLRCANLLEDSQQGDILFEGEAVTWKGAGHARHPGDKDQDWKPHPALKNVGNESPVWEDVNGDGRPDLVFVEEDASDAAVLWRLERGP